MPGASDHRPHFGNFGLDPELCEDKEHGLLGSHPLPPHRHPPPRSKEQKHRVVCVEAVSMCQGANTRSPAQLAAVG